MDKSECKKAFEDYQGEPWDTMCGTQKTIWYPIFKKGWCNALDAATDVLDKRSEP